MNANITRIDAVETVEEMGETTKDQAGEFIEFLEKELANEYPNATISVELDNRQSTSTLYVECASDDQGYDLESDPKSLVHEFMNYCWERWA